MKAINQIEKLREKPIRRYTSKKTEHYHPKLLKLKVNQTKITAYLGDKREISIPIDELAKRWKRPNLRSGQLKKYEIFPDQFSLNFPEVDVYTSVLTFTGNYCGCC